MRRIVFQILWTFLVICLSSPSAHANNNEIFDRVMKTGVLRCGYLIWPPIFEKDVNTGKFGGFMHDVMEKLASNLSLKIEWVEEANYSNLFEGYGSRFDAICGPLAPTAARARASDFTVPMLGAAYYLYARAEDSRFDDHYNAVNSADIRYAAVDGEYSAILAKEDYPLAQIVSIAQFSDPSQLMMEIATGKADVTATEPVQFMKFNQSNPGKLKRVSGPPVRVLPLSLGLPQGEYKLKAMMDAAIMELVETGYIDKALAKYPEYDKTLLRLKPRFEFGEK